MARRGEDVNIRRIAVMEGDAVGTYSHGSRMGAMVASKGGDIQLIKDVVI